MYIDNNSDIMTNGEPKSMCPPKDENIKKPFFAYGIFKPAQIAFSKIKDFHWKCEPHDIPHKMLIRDGVPIIEKKERPFITKGFKIWFNDESCEEAYKRISETQPYKLYKWDVIEVDGDECNILIGKDPYLGSKPFEDKNNNYINDYDGKNDPYFNGLVGFIGDEINKDEFYGENYFYNLQMSYMLLWSAIDRYCSLKYGAYRDQWDLRSHLANDWAFIESLQRCWDDGKIERRQFVYSTNLNEYKLTKNPWFAINYYYTIRCNVVHRGKQIISEEEFLYKALNELLEIFDGVIKNTFKI